MYFRSDQAQTSVMEQLTPLDMFTITCAALGIDCLESVALFLWLDEVREERRRDERLEAILRPTMLQQDGAPLVYEDTLDMEPWEIQRMYRNIHEELRGVSRTRPCSPPRDSREGLLNVPLADESPYARWFLAGVAPQAIQPPASSRQEG